MKKIFLLFLFLFFPLTANAANFSLETKNNPTAIKENFTVDLMLDSEGEVINAVQGVVNFPVDDLILKDISFGDTVVVFWLDKPEIKNSSVSFSGIIPGGYVGNGGKIFSLIFYPRKGPEISSLITLSNVEALLNDGAGTAAKTKLSPLQISFSATSTAITTTEQMVDKFAPEAFQISIVNDPDIFSGQNFIVFDTQDKGVGIERYEILESKKARYNRETESWDPPRKESWNISSSPYVLQDQTLESFIFVRAIDKSGNVRLSYVASENIKMWYNYSYLIYIAVFLLLAVVACYVFFKNKKKNN